MVDQSASERALQRRRALSRWENEGGAICTPQATPADQGAEAGTLSTAELSRLRARVVALENVVIALLARAQVDQHDLVREMAGYLSAAGQPAEADDGRTAAEMLSLLDRSRELCSE
jgi:hypothetical protein